MTEPSPAVDSPNAAMAEHWNGFGGEHWVANVDRLGGNLAGYGRAVLEAAGIRPTDRVLDVGCGTGPLTLEAARLAPEGHALGVDIGAPLIEAATAAAAASDVDNVAFELADAQVHPFEPRSIDVVISRFGVMFFDDPVAAFTNLRGALADTGRLAFVCWQPLLANDWSFIPGAALVAHVGPPDPAPAPDAPGPFAFGDPDRVRAILGAAGFGEVTVDEITHPMWLGSDPDDAVAFVRNQGMARALLDGKPPELVETALAAMRDALAAVATPDGVELPGRGWVVAARAT